MKKIITLKCRKYGSLSVPLYHVCVYDINNNIIIDDYTNNIGNIDIELPHYGIYKIHIINPKNCIRNCMVILVNKNFPNELFIVNEIKQNRPHSIHFVLIDENYKNLPIMKGEIILWQKSI